MFTIQHFMCWQSVPSLLICLSGRPQRGVNRAVRGDFPNEIHARVEAGKCLTPT